MTIRVRLSPAVVQVSSSVSPFLEAFWSLHSLHNPGQHAWAHSWMLAIRNRLGSELQDQLREIAFAFRGSPTSCGVPLPDVEEGSFTDELARFRQATPAQAARFFTRSFYVGREEISTTERVPVQVAERFLAHARTVRASIELAEQALRSPREALAAFAELFEQYWRVGFFPRWPTRAVQLAREAALAKDRAGSDLTAFLRSLPDVQVDPDERGFTIGRPHDHDLTLGTGDRLVVTPSAFLLPHLRVSCERPGILALGYPSHYEVRLIAPLAPPEQMLLAFGALGDGTRVRILRYLREGPRTVQNLSVLVQLTPGTVSSHLRKLEAAGLVVREPTGHYVRYHLTLDPSDLVGQLSAYLDDRLDPDG